MGNCLNSHDTWTRLKRKQFDIRKIMKESSAATPNRIEFQITNIVNVPGANNVVTSVPAAVISNVNVSVVPVATTSGGVVNVSARQDDDMVSTVVSRIIADAPKNMENLQITSFRNVSIFTYNELSMATSQFRPDLILGEGGFGLVYKGVIDGNVRPGFRSTVVAVKELNPDGYQGDREWLAEVNYLGQFSHPNLVKLIGYCCEDEHRLLVYEYMACGSLERHLFRRHNTLSWSTRMKIALDAAKGLAFLHEAERPIIYRDFKTSNILLDADFNAKLSDFGLAKDGPMGDQTHVSTRVMGTYGYAAPEYIMTGHLTARSDVYSFGVVLLELMVGKRALDKSRPSHEKNLVEWARPLLIRTTKLLRIVDPRMEGQYSGKTAGKVANLAHRCLSENPKTRPTMGEVVRDLEAYNQDEALIQSCRARRKLEEGTNEAAASSTCAEDQVNKHEGVQRETSTRQRRVKAGNATSRDGHSDVLDYQHCQYSSDSGGGGQHSHSRSVSSAINGVHKHSRSGRNGCTPSMNSDGRQKHSRSAPDVGISGCG